MWRIDRKSWKMDSYDHRRLYVTVVKRRGGGHGVGGGFMLTTIDGEWYGWVSLCVTGMDRAPVMGGAWRSGYEALYHMTRLAEALPDMIDGPYECADLREVLRVVEGERPDIELEEQYCSEEVRYEQDQQQEQGQAGRA